jgi:hypothetical protein
VIRLPRLPIAVPPARHEIVTSYVARLASLHGMPFGELWEQLSVPRQPGAKRRLVIADRLAEIAGRSRRQLAGALVELRDPAPDWRLFRHDPQTGCPACAARHPGGTVFVLLPHHRYVCVRHRYWIGPPDIDHPAPRLDDLPDVVAAQRGHLRLVLRLGWAAAYDAVLTGFLICAHHWSNIKPASDTDAWRRWHQRAHTLIPAGTARTTFSASRLFAAVYPEAVSVGALIGSPTWRTVAAGDTDHKARFYTEIGRRLGLPDYPPNPNGDVIAHWMRFDSWRPPSAPPRTFPETRHFGSHQLGKAHPKSIERHESSAFWFERRRVSRDGGTTLLHHRHIQPVLIREWSPAMAEYAGAIWASQTLIEPTPKPPGGRTVTRSISRV